MEPYSCYRTATKNSNAVFTMKIILYCEISSKVFMPYICNVSKKYDVKLYH